MSQGMRKLSHIGMTTAFSVPYREHTHFLSHFYLSRITRLLQNTLFPEKIEAQVQVLRGEKKP